MRKNRIIRWLATALMVPVMLLMLMGCALDYYHADAKALTLMEKGQGIYTQENQIILQPEGEWDTALVFYPGANVEAEAYLPLLDRIRETGVLCILVEMPIRLAILDANAAGEIQESFPEVEHWYLGGHSLGGAMASLYASFHPSDWDGVILLGASVFGTYPTRDALTVYGSLDRSRDLMLHYTENVVVLEGGNHAQFGSYGAQWGDPEATISEEEQQAQTVKAVLEFLSERGKNKLD